MELLTLLVSIVASTLLAIISVSLLAGKYKEKVDNLMNLKVHDELNNIKNNISSLLEFKNWATKFIDSQLFQAKSPLSLTTKGEKLIKESGFKAIFEIVKSELAKELLEKMAPKTRYDAQEKARSFMDDLSRKDYESFLPIKTYAFEKGEDYAQILRAGSILLRDYYLQIHPEITD